MATMNVEYINEMQALLRRSKKASLAKNTNEDSTGKIGTGRARAIKVVDVDYSWFITVMLFSCVAAYIMAYFVIDDAVNYQRGGWRTGARIKCAVSIVVSYTPWIAMACLLPSVKGTGVKNNAMLSAFCDIGSTFATLVVLNFFATTASYLYTAYMEEYDMSVPNESFNMDDVVDMRKRRINSPLRKPCTLATFEGNEDELRDYGTLRTVPMGIGELPDENIAGKLSWYVDTMFARNKEELDFNDDNAFLRAGKEALGMVGDTFKFILSQFSFLDAIAKVVPLMLSIYYMSMNALLQKAAMQAAMGQGAGQSMMYSTEPGDGMHASVLIKVAGYFAIFSFIASAHTGSDTLSQFTNPSNSACFPSIIAKIISGGLFSVPDNIFKKTIRSAAPPPNVYANYEYYDDAMSLLKSSGFCSPTDWISWCKWVWATGEVELGTEDDKQMDIVIDDMETSPHSWPAAVARNAVMFAYNSTKYDAVIRMTGLDGDGFDEYASKEWLKEGKYSLISRYLRAYPYQFRKTVLQMVLRPVFYKSRPNFNPSRVTGVQPTNESEVGIDNEKGGEIQEKFMAYRRQYVRKNLEKVKNMFMISKIKEQFVAFKKLGVDSDLLRALVIENQDEVHLEDFDISAVLHMDDLVLEPSSMLSVEQRDNVEALKNGQYRMKSIAPFLSPDGSRNHNGLGITLNKGYCASVFPGPPALTEDRQYRFNGQSGLFTLMPVWDGANKYGSNTSWYHVIGGGWLQKSGAYNPKTGELDHITLYDMGKDAVNEQNEFKNTWENKTPMGEAPEGIYESDDLCDPSVGNYEAAGVCYYSSGNVKFVYNEERDQEEIREAKINKGKGDVWGTIFTFMNPF